MLSAVIPRDFALGGNGATLEDRTIVWHLGDVAADERGAVTATLRGTLPDDLTGAVYDLPGYEGHTAFVDGLSIDVTLASSAGTVTTEALANTGVPPVSSCNGVNACLNNTGAIGANSCNGSSACENNTAPIGADSATAPRPATTIPAPSVLTPATAPKPAPSILAPSATTPVRTPASPAS